jgi:hypothetical protein
MYLNLSVVVTFVKTVKRFDGIFLIIVYICLVIAYPQLSAKSLYLVYSG